MFKSYQKPVQRTSFEALDDHKQTSTKGSGHIRRITGGVVIALSVVVGFYLYFSGSNKSELDQRWSTSNESSQIQVEHSLWQSILDDYLVDDTQLGVNLFDYTGLLDDGRETLDNYVKQLVSMNPLSLNRREQKAYWINLYNAATVQLIIDNYPITSITKLGNTLSSFGPWDDNVVEINGVVLSLNDIEHRIIRPLYDDYRIHFAVNCASIGCPNLAVNAFTAANMEQELDNAAADYLNHPRGLSMIDDELQLSTLFKWYAEDFGNDQAALLSTLSRHVDGPLKAQLSQYNGTLSYAYDWSLNGHCQIDGGCDE